MHQPPGLRNHPWLLTSGQVTFVHPTFVQASYVQATYVPVMIATPREVMNISAFISVQIEPNFNSFFDRPAFNGHTFHLEICPRTFVLQTIDIFNKTVETNINSLKIQFTFFQT